MSSSYYLPGVCLEQSSIQLCGTPGLAHSVDEETQILECSNRYRLTMVLFPGGENRKLTWPSLFNLLLLLEKTRADSWVVDWGKGRCRDTLLGWTNGCRNGVCHCDNSFTHTYTYACTITYECSHTQIPSVVSSHWNWTLCFGHIYLWPSWL